MPETLRSLALWLQTAFRASPVLVTLQCLVQIVQSALGPAQALGLGLMVDGIAGVRSDLVPGVALVIAAAAATVLAEAVSEPLTGTIFERIHGRLHRDLLALTTSIPGNAHHERADVANRIEQLSRETWRLSRSARVLMLIVGTLVNAVIVLAILVTVQPLLLVLPVLGLLRVWAATVSGRMLWGAIERTTPFSRLIHQLVDIAKEPRHGMEVRVFGLRPVLRDRLRELQRRLSDVHAGASWRGAALEAATRLLFAAAYVAAIVLVVVQAGRHEATAGQVALVLLLANRVDQAASGLATCAREMGQLLKMFGGYVWLRDYAGSAAWSHSTAPAPATLREGITLRGVSFRYPGTEADVLADLDLDLPAGATVALVGENGAGKTTLVKLLLRLYDPTGGAVLLDGQDLREVDPVAWRQRTAAGFQDFTRFEFVARETVGVGDLSHCDDDDSIRAALVHGDAATVVDGLPGGLGTQLGRRFAGGVDLSGGQWQRLALARAFMRPQPVLLVLDEPTAALDPEAEHALFERFAAASQEASRAGGVTVLVSHRFSTVRMADLIVVLDRGRIVELGTHGHLVASGGRYAELFDLQARAYR